MINGLSLCSGVGCIDLGFKRYFGSTYRTTHYVEREAYCAEILARRMEEGHLDVAPIFSDISEFDGYLPDPDIVVSGLPCQPYSVAGLGKGNGDGRALWPHFLKVVRNSEPAAIFLENVPGFLKHFGPVYAGLREMGFEFAEPLSLRAGDMGAPHERERLFIYASHPDRPNIFSEEHPDTDRGRLQGFGGCWVLDKERKTLWNNIDRLGMRASAIGSGWLSESPVYRVDDGTPRRLDELRAIGNGVVPQVVEAALTEFAKWGASQ